MSNPKVAALIQSAKESYDELNALLDGPVGKLYAKQLYQAPTENAWTLMENLAHITEMMPYWALEMAKLIEQPGRKFGRTVEDQTRLAAISEHGHDSLSQMRAALSGSYAHFEAILSEFKDSDLQLTGQHVSRGEQTVEWFIEVFIVKHLREHVEQLRESLAMVK